MRITTGFEQMDLNFIVLKLCTALALYLLCEQCNRLQLNLSPNGYFSNSGSKEGSTVKRLICSHFHHPESSSFFPVPPCLEQFKKIFVHLIHHTVLIVDEDAFVVREFIGIQSTKISLVRDRRGMEEARQTGH